MSGRIRTIKPEWLEDEVMASATSDARVLSIALILMADDYGNGRCHHVTMASRVFPVSGNSLESLQNSSARFLAALSELEAMRFVGLYGDDRQHYFAIRNWAKHQKVNHPGKPLVPSPPESLWNVSRDSQETLKSDSGGSLESLLPDLRPTTTTNDREGTDARACVLSQASDSGLLGRPPSRFADTECPDEIEPLPKTVALIAEQKLPPVADLLDVFISSRRKVGARCANWREDFHGFVRKWNLNEMRSDKNRADSEPVRRTITYEDLTPTREQTLERARLLREAKARGAAERAAKAALSAGCPPVAIGAQNEATTPEAPRQ